MLLAVSALQLVNAEEEKILSDKELEIKNDEPVQEDLGLLNDLLTEIQNGKGLLNEHTVSIFCYRVVLLLSFPLTFLFLLLIDLHKRTIAQCCIKKR